MTTSSANPEHGRKGRQNCVTLSENSLRLDRGHLENIQNLLGTRHKDRHDIKAYAAATHDPAEPNDRTASPGKNH
jgi:hypothetical protein